MLDFGEQDAPDVKADGLELAEHAGELLRRPILVGVSRPTWKWHVNAWRLAGVAAFVFGHSSSLLVTVVAIDQLREGGLEAMSGIDNFTKTLDVGSVVLGKGTHKTFVVGPGEALWIPTGYLPLVTGIKHGDEEDKKSVAAIFPILEASTSTTIKNMTEADGHDLKSYVSSAFVNASPMWKKVKDVTLDWALKLLP